mmetsp:Transcript_137537/g.439465  ORF Transcript_137537/g.439465 Transcript_137537/m.439465 type:complete len:320 (-) Transcript_137537:348-1307(-)
MRQQHGVGRAVSSAPMAVHVLLPVCAARGDTGHESAAKRQLVQSAQGLQPRAELQSRGGPLHGLYPLPIPEVPLQRRRRVPVQDPCRLDPVLWQVDVHHVAGGAEVPVHHERRPEVQRQARGHLIGTENGRGDQREGELGICQRLRVVDQSLLAARLRQLLPSDSELLGGQHEARQRHRRRPRARRCPGLRRRLPAPMQERIPRLHAVARLAAQGRLQNRPPVRRRRAWVLPAAEPRPDLQEQSHPSNVGQSAREAESHQLPVVKVHDACTQQRPAEAAVGHRPNANGPVEECIGQGAHHGRHLAIQLHIVITSARVVA